MVNIAVITDMDQRIKYEGKNASYHQRDKTLFQKFWEKALLDDDNKCWNWIASRNSKGYGNFYISIGNSKSKHVLAHRIAYKLRYGDFDESLHVLHYCDNPSCVNPTHLFLGTNYDNVLDKLEKGRMQDMKGENAPASKLTENDVREIRKLREEEGYTLQYLGELFGVDTSTIGKITNRVNWKHVK